MKLDELIHIIRPIDSQGAYNGKPGRLRLDSRSVRKGDVFIALKGTVSDGHDFIPDAVRKGAGIIVTERFPGNHHQTVPNSSGTSAGEVLYLKVADTRRIAGELAQALAGYPARSMKMIGITGTNGKTTVSTLVYQVLHTLGYNTGMLGTVDIRMGNKVQPSRLTTPDAVSLARILDEMSGAGTAYCAMEVSSHALEQRRVEGIDFDVAAYTNLSQDHLDYHRDMASYTTAKKRLFDNLRSDAVAVVNRDDSACHKIIADCPADIWEFGFRDSRDFRILDESPRGMVLDLDGTIVSTPLTGRYNAYNVAQAYLICLALGCTKNSVAGALGEATGAPGRLERVAAESLSPDTAAPAVFVDYAHTPDALENVLQALHKVRGKDETLHVVFGCGGDRDRTKRPKMGKIAERYADVVTLTSDNPRTEDPDAIIRDIRKGISRTEHLFVEPKRRKAIRSAILDADTRSLILIAGKGHETYQEVHGRRHKFDDREIATKALTEWIGRRASAKNRRDGTTNREVC